MNKETKEAQSFWECIDGEALYGGIKFQLVIALISTLLFASALLIGGAEERARLINKLGYTYNRFFIENNRCQN